MEFDDNQEVHNIEESLVEAKEDFSMANQQQKQQEEQEQPPQAP